MTRRSDSQLHFGNYAFKWSTNTLTSQASTEHTLSCHSDPYAARVWVVGSWCCCEALFRVARDLLVREALCLLLVGYRYSIRGREDNTHTEDSVEFCSSLFMLLIESTDPSAIPCVGIKWTTVWWVFFKINFMSSFLVQRGLFHSSKKSVGSPASIFQNYI